MNNNIIAVARGIRIQIGVIVEGEGDDEFRAGQDLRIVAGGDLLRRSRGVPDAEVVHEAK